MSNTYKTIARARDIAKAILRLPNPEWNKTSLVKEMGITFGLYADIMEMDPVSVKIKTPTVEKLKAFVSKHEHILDKKKEPAHLLNGKPMDEKVKAKSLSAKAIPKNHEAIDDGEDLLVSLNILSDKFQKKGYRLSVRIENIAIHEL